MNYFLIYLSTGIIINIITFTVLYINVLKALKTILTIGLSVKQYCIIILYNIIGLLLWPIQLIGHIICRNKIQAIINYIANPYKEEA